MFSHGEEESRLCSQRKVLSRSRSRKLFETDPPIVQRRFDKCMSSKLSVLYEIRWTRDTRASCSALNGATPTISTKTKADILCATINSKCMSLRLFNSRHSIFVFSIRYNPSTSVWSSIDVTSLLRRTQNDEEKKNLPVKSDRSSSRFHKIVKVSSQRRRGRSVQFINLSSSVINFRNTARTLDRWRVLSACGDLYPYVSRFSFPTRDWRFTKKVSVRQSIRKFFNTAAATMTLHRLLIGHHDHPVEEKQVARRPVTARRCQYRTPAAKSILPEKSVTSIKTHHEVWFPLHGNRPAEWWHLDQCYCVRSPLVFHRREESFLIFIIIFYYFFIFYYYYFFLRRAELHDGATHSALRATACAETKEIFAHHCCAIVWINVWALVGTLVMSVVFGVVLGFGKGAGVGPSVCGGGSDTTLDGVCGGEGRSRDEREERWRWWWWWWWWWWGAWYVVRGAWCVVCGVWGVECGVWCVFVYDFIDVDSICPQRGDPLGAF